MSDLTSRPDRHEVSSGPTRARELLDAALADGPAGVLAAFGEARSARGLSYRALAQATSISSATLQGWLTGKYVPQMSMRTEFLRLVAVLGLEDPPGTAQGATGEQWWEGLRAPARPRIDVPSPYPGMRPYDLETAAEFPGRRALVDSLRDRLVERLAGGAGPLLMVTGRSGVGKSSVVAAAVGALPEGVRRESHNPGPAAAEALRRLTRGDADVLVIDHSEMLWTETEPEVRAEILQCLSALDERAAAPSDGPADPPSDQPVGRAVVLVMRADAVAPTTDVEVLRRTLESASVVVGPITEADASEIITGPPGRHGIVVEQGLPEIILRDLGVGGHGPTAVGTADQLVGALPLLSQTMRSLWEQRSVPDRLTIADYQRTGGISSSVEVSAEAAYAALSAPARHQVWPVLREMIRLDAPIPMRRVVPLSTWDDDASAEVLDTFLQARLLMRDPEGISLSHDLLLSTWPRLATWLARAREWSTARRMLSRFATFWHESGRPGDLLSSRTAALLLEGEESWTDDRSEQAPLSRVEREFLEASRAARDSVLEAAEAENRRLRASRWRFGIAAAATSVALVIALLAAGVSISASRQLNEARAVALSGEISARSETIGETMPAEASQLAVAAYHLNDNPTTRSQLVSLTAAPLPRRLVTPAGPGAVAATQDLLAKVGDEGQALLIDPATGQVRDIIDAGVSSLYVVSLVAADGRTLLAASGEDGADPGGPSAACVWDVTGTPRELGCTQVPATSNAAAILESGEAALFGAADGTIQRLALEGGATRELAPIAGPTGPDAEGPAGVMGIASAGGRVLVAGRDGTLGLLRDPLGSADYAAVLALPGLQSVTLSADGTRFAAATRDNSLLLGTVAGDALALDGHEISFESWVNDAVFLPDGRVAAVSSDQTLRLLNPDGAPAETQGHPALLTSVTAIGDALVTYGVDGVVNLWPAEAFPAPTSRGRLFEITGDTRAGEITASLGEEDGVLQVERLQADGTMHPLEVPAIDARTSYGIGTSADGRHIGTAGWDGDLFLWTVGEDSLSEPTFLQVMPHGSLITYVKFSPDGTRLAVSAQNHDEVVVLAVDPGDGDSGGGSRITAEQTLVIPVASGGTMTFLDEDTLVLDDGLDGLEVWDVAVGERLSTIAPSDVTDETTTRPSSVLARPGHPGQIGFTTADLTAGILDLSDPTSPRLVSAIAALADTPLSVAFSPDGSQMAIAAVSHARVHAVDGAGNLDPQGLRLSGPVSTHITDVQFLDEGTRLAASTYSGRIWHWDLEADRAAASLCTETGARLDIAEARALAPSLPKDAELCG